MASIGSSFGCQSSRKKGKETPANSKNVSQLRALIGCSPWFYCWWEVKSSLGERCLAISSEERNAPIRERTVGYIRTWDTDQVPQEIPMSDTLVNVAYPASDDLLLWIVLGACRFEARLSETKDWVAVPATTPPASGLPESSRKGERF
jgi:hypothetical protein